MAVMRTIRFRDQTGSKRVGNLEDNVITTAFDEFDPVQVELLPPTKPSKVIAIGRNHRDSVAEMGIEPPEKPRLFFKPAHTVVGPDVTVELPPGKENIVWEAELGVVIGQQCRYVPREKAHEIIAGYTCVNDISNLDDVDIDPGRVRVKGFDGAAPIGPVIASPDIVPDDADIELRVNGIVKQQSDISRMLFSVPEIIEEITQYLTLEEGDVICTGTPPGKGPLTDGDHVAITIEGVGTLEHDVYIP